MHAENVKRLQDWIARPSIAAENLNYPQGPQHMALLATQAGLTRPGAADYGESASPRSSKCAAQGFNSRATGGLASLDLGAGAGGGSTGITGK